MSKEKAERKNRLGDPLHVLNSSGEEGLLVHVANSEHASIAQAMEFFGFCEGAFNCLLAPGVEPFTIVGLRKRIRLFQIILPNMACHQPSCHTGGNALLSARTVLANLAVAPILTVTGTIGGFPCQFLFLWTKVNISVFLV